MNLNQTTIKKHLEDIHGRYYKISAADHHIQGRGEAGRSYVHAGILRSSPKNVLLKNWPQPPRTHATASSATLKASALRPWSWNISRLWKKFRPRWR